MGPAETGRGGLNQTIRIGCALTYEATGLATLLLHVSPLPNPAHVVLSEALTLGDNLPVELFTDSHGNRVRRVTLTPGMHSIRHDAIVAISSQPEASGNTALAPLSPANLPPEVLRYTFPSRYADSDKLVDFAWQHFGQIEDGWPRVQAISRWIHENIEYRYFSGDSILSAWDILQRGYGVCRDFAHVAIALNRTFNIPTRYVTAQMPDIGFTSPEAHMDFHAYAEVYIGGQWLAVDARFDVPRIGRIKIACGQDAIDGAFSTIFGGANLTYFQVWAYQVARGTIGVGDPLDFSQRLDNRTEIITEPPY
jgi:transglutaminase-like putative cysteine protease